MKVDTHKCDVCGAQKGDNNHWFKVATHEPDFWSISAWKNQEPNGVLAQLDLCSDACAVKALQQWLSAQKEASHPGENNEV